MSPGYSVPLVQHISMPSVPFVITVNTANQTVVLFSPARELASVFIPEYDNI